MVRSRRPQRRKLAAILFADVTGWSRLMGRDESGTHAEFKLHLKEHIRPVIKAFGGRLVKLLGDGVLVEFDSAVNAVSCAVELQDGLVERNQQVPAERQLRFRMGINLGDVILDANDIFGDSVNVAARIQALAAPDGILVSQSIAQQVTGKIAIALEDIGEHMVKNIAQPVRIFRVANKGEKLQELPADFAPRPSAIPAIAVLPFQNMSGDPEQQYFSDGIAEDIITELSRFRTISVVARNSSFAFRDKAIDVSKVARELGTQFVVEGSVRKFQTRTRITVQLVNAESRLHVWADKYDVDLSEIFSVQDDVTRRVVGTLVPKMEREQLEIARRQPTGEVRAYDLYLRGKAAFYAASDGAGIAAARRYFEEAVAIDPRFAAAYCFLVRIDNIMVKYVSAGSPVDDLRERAWQNARKAASLDDSDPRAHICLSWCHIWRREFDAARKHLDMATRLNPNDADCAMDRGTTLLYLGEPDEAIETMLTGIRLNPFHPDSYLVDLAEAYFVARRYREMLEVAGSLTDPSPQFAAWKAAGYAYAGRDREARQQAEKFVGNIRTIWAGDAAAGPAEYVSWLLNFHPFQRSEDTEHFAAGLRMAGLPTLRGSS